MYNAFFASLYREFSARDVVLMALARFVVCVCVCGGGVPTARNAVVRHGIFAPTPHMPEGGVRLEFRLRRERVSSKPGRLHSET